MVAQYLRFCSLVVSDSTGNGIQLSDLSIKFAVHHNTYIFPHTADIRIYNLSNETQARMGKEFTKVTLQAGYEGNYGVIFQGDIKQVTIGYENSVDGFTNIYAADGDLLHNFAIINKTLPAGYTQDHVWAAITEAAAKYNPSAPINTPVGQAQSPRGKVMYGPLRETIRDWANTNGHLVTVDNGILTAMPLLAFKQTDIVVINADTGMVGVPEQTQEGITVTTLLNPALSWGTRVQLNREDITRKLIGNEEIERQIILEQKALPPFIPELSGNGLYKVLTVDHIGETRGNTWYSEIICISLDPTSALGELINAQALINLVGKQ